MKWIIDNWSLLIVIFAAVVVLCTKLKKFAEMPSEEQIAKVKEAMLEWVYEAEDLYGDKMGQIKLRHTYNLFVEKFPDLVAVVPFETYSEWVKDVLKHFEHLLETNPTMKAKLEGVEDGESK